MPFSTLFLVYVTLALIRGTLGAVGPTAVLNIVNRNIAPDGFNRS